MVGRSFLKRDAEIMRECDHFLVDPLTEEDSGQRH